MNTHSTESRVGSGGGRAGVELGEPRGRGQRDAGAARDMLEGPGERALSEELVERALSRVRAGVPVGELPAEVRDRLTDGLIDELLGGVSGEEELSLIHI